jgi:hypothetical protein
MTTSSSSSYVEPDYKPILDLIGLEEKKIARFRYAKLWKDEHLIEVYTKTGIYNALGYHFKSKKYLRSNKYYICDLDFPDDIVYCSFYFCEPGYEPVDPDKDYDMDDEKRILKIAMQKVDA